MPLAAVVDTPAILPSPLRIDRAVAAVIPPENPEA
jgi:hypothetical protein